MPIEQEMPLAGRAVDALAHVLLDHVACVAWSGGKDSSAVLGLVLQAALRLRTQGVSVAPILITHGDTLVENPEVRAYADAEIARIRAWGLEHGVAVKVLVARPNLTESWQMRVIGGKGLPAFPGGNHDCTTDMKIQPMQRLRKKVHREMDQDADRPVVTIIGTRFEESPQRAARMRERGESPEQVWTGDDGALYFSPIALWGMDDVWEYLGYCRSAHPDFLTFSRFEDVFRIYADAAGTTAPSWATWPRRASPSRAARAPDAPCAPPSGATRAWRP